MTNQEQIAVLEKHKLNISNCSTFEEFKVAQINYIEFLIQCFENEDQHEFTIKVDRD